VIGYWPADASTGPPAGGGGVVPQVDAGLLAEPLQNKPAAQAPTPLMGQQTWPAAPQGPHMPMVQRLPAAHELPQQGWPGWPQGAHMPGMPEARPMQARPMVQLPPPLPPVPQQICPMPPQVAHTLPVAEVAQPRPGWQDELPPPPSALSLCGQQGWSAPPQVAQVPALFITRPPQPSPAMQVPVLPRPQQAWPVAPQVAHLFPVGLRTQPRLGAQVASPPWQQG
jgi:hypothetical protein